MATDLRANDTIQVRVPQGGGSVRDVPLSELNEYISTEEAADITTLVTYVGDYSSPSGREGSDIATDLATVYGSVETAETGLNARTDDLEKAVGTYSGENDIATDLAAALGDIDDLEELVGDYTPEDTDIATDLAAALGDIDALQAVAPEYIATFDTATAANMDLTVAATPEEGETVTIGTVVYKARRDVLSELGTKASGVLTLTANVAANDTVSIGNTGNEIVYKFVAEPADPYDVKLGADAGASIDNLIAAITFDGGLGTNEGSLYGIGTTAHPNVTAAAGAGDTMDVTALSYGFKGNSNNTTDPVDGGTAMAFGNVTLTGGIDPRADGDVYVNSSAEAFIDNLEKAIEATGTNGTDYYFTTPAARTDVEVSAQTESTLTITAKVKGAAGNSIALAETLSNVGSLWTGGAEFLSNGVDGQIGATGKIIFTASAAVYCCTDGTKCVATDSSGWKTAALS